MTSTSSSPSPRHHTTTADDRPPFFDTMVKKLCWSKAETVPGRHPDRWRKDADGNIVFRRYLNCQGCLCFEYNHIVPYSKGGESVIENCQISRTKVKRFNWLRRYSCDKNLTDKQMDAFEIGVYGDVIPPGYQCCCSSIDEFLAKYKPKD